MEEEEEEEKKAEARKGEATTQKGCGTNYSLWVARRRMGAELW